MRKIISLILISTFGGLMFTKFWGYNFISNGLARDYFINNVLEQVGSRNIVTGIYLDYRLYDSLFEAGILLIAVAGIIFMAKKDEGKIGGDKDGSK